MVENSKYMPIGEDMNINIRDISEIKGLGAMTHLDTLILDNNQLTEINGLETLQNLTNYLLRILFFVLNEMIKECHLQTLKIMASESLFFLMILFSLNLN